MVKDYHRKYEKYKQKYRNYLKTLKQAGGDNSCPLRGNPCDIPEQCITGVGADINTQTNYGCILCENNRCINFNNSNLKDTYRDRVTQNINNYINRKWPRELINALSHNDPIFVNRVVDLITDSCVSLDKLYLSGVKGRDFLNDHGYIGNFFIKNNLYPEAFKDILYSDDGGILTGWMHLARGHNTYNLSFFEIYCLRLYTRGKSQNIYQSHSGSMTYSLHYGMVVNKAYRELGINCELFTIFQTQMLRICDHKLPAYNNYEGNNLILWRGMDAIGRQNFGWNDLVINDIIAFGGLLTSASATISHAKDFLSTRSPESYHITNHHGGLLLKIYCMHPGDNNPNHELRTVRRTPTNWRWIPGRYHYASTMETEAIIYANKSAFMVVGITIRTINWTTWEGDLSLRGVKCIDLVEIPYDWPSVHGWSIKQFGGLD